MNTAAPDPVAPWRFLIDDASGQALTTRVDSELARTGVPEASQIAAWRRNADAETVRAAISLVRARRASGWKFRTPDPVIDLEGGEQASPWPVAAYKAARLAPSDAPILDLCCGVGADACELVRAGLDVTGVDLDPIRAWMCERNASCRSLVEDVTQTDVASSVIHLDPSRRNESPGGRDRRLHGLDAMRPPLDDVVRLSDHAIGSAIKLSPAVEVDRLHERDPASMVEFISFNGGLNQAVWWRGVLARDGASVGATLLSSDETLFTLVGSPRDPDERAPVAGVLHTVDSAIERARLLVDLYERTGLLPIHPKLGILTGDTVIEHPALTAFHVEAEMPFRREAVRDWLAAHDGGIAEVKTRGRACDPDAEQAALRRSGSTTFTVFILRFDDRVRAVITRRHRVA